MGIVKEVWRDIPGYEGLYQASTEGRVQRVNGATLVPRNDGRGYVRVCLYNSAGRWDISIHRLVAIVFVPRKSEGLQVNHINEKKSDNRACNLEWISQAANLSYGTARARATVKKSMPVQQLSRDGEIINSYTSTQDAERKTGVHSAHVSRCARYIRPSAGGYVWRYGGNVNG